MNFCRIKENVCNSFYKTFTKITGEYRINCKEFRVTLKDIVKMLTKLRTNLCDRTSVLYHLTPQIVGSLVYYSTSLVDYTGRVEE